MDARRKPQATYAITMSLFKPNEVITDKVIWSAKSTPTLAMARSMAHTLRDALGADKVTLVATKRII